MGVDDLVLRVVVTLGETEVAYQQQDGDDNHHYRGYDDLLLQEYSSSSVGDW